MRTRKVIKDSLGILSLLMGAAVFASDMVQVDDNYCIDKYESSLEIVSPSTEPQAVSKFGVLPTVNISQVEAQAACAQAGKRLCTDAEWLRACKSAADYIYPYGNTLVSGVCNDQGAIANTGSYSDCISAEGALDLVGNVNEWTDDPGGTSRGGFFLNISINGLGCNYRTIAHSVGHKDEYTGFRCCSDSCVTSVQAEIDVKPGSDPNCFNINGHGVIPVAILGGTNFDITLVDQTTLLFGGLEVRVRGNKGPLCHVEDTNADGHLDLVCQFEDNPEYWAPGGGAATLTGIYNGTVFEGTGSICVVP